MTKIEKERKWLLKRLPRNITPDIEIDIIQYYKDGVRYRREVAKENGITTTTYNKLIKKSLGKGINEESSIEDIGFTEFNSNRNYVVNKEIAKMRYVFLLGDKKIEIDAFDNIILVLMEVEDVELSDVLEFPEQIAKVMLMEVTGIEAFNNSSLAE